MFRFFRRASKEDAQPEYVEDYRARAEVIAITKRLGSITANLRPCPFCGGNASEITDLLNSEYSKFFAHIECEQCGIRTKQVEITAYGDPMEELRRIWERRTSAQTEVEYPSYRDTTTDRCNHCNMPRSYMPECAATRDCHLLRQCIQKEGQ